MGLVTITVPKALKLRGVNPLTCLCFCKCRVGGSGLLPLHVHFRTSLLLSIKSLVGILIGLY